MPLNEFLCATTIIFFPDFIVGAIDSYHKGITLSVVNFKLFIILIFTSANGSNLGSTS